MAITKVIVVGAGIAGPVLAMLLKAKGYDPVVYERTPAPTDLGLSLCLQPNGLRVLALIPGLLDKVERRLIEEVVAYSALPGKEHELARFRSSLVELCGHGLEGVRRPAFLRTLVEAAQERGVRVVFDHQLIGLEEHEESVKVTFANGATDEGSFVVGCDGLHSNTRICLFGKEEATFTGLTQTGGVSPYPDTFNSQGTAMFNIYGDGFHMIGYPVNERQISWAITQREAEAKETWRHMDEARQQEFKEGLFSHLPFGAGELVRSADRIVKYGLYDRPELTSWHKGRVVLIGDAAHPTSPHLGQGANQAFEDVYHLVRLLLKHNPSGAPPTTDTLSSIFIDFEQLRIPRTSELVKKARQQGEMRVVSGVEACKKRDESMAAVLSGVGKDKETLKRHFADLLEHPFGVGQSEL